MSKFIDDLRANTSKSRQEKELIIVQYADLPSIALREFLEFWDKNGVSTFGYGSKFDEIFANLSDDEMLVVCRAVYKMCVCFDEFIANFKAKINGQKVNFIYENLDELINAFSQKLLKYAKNQTGEIITQEIIKPLIKNLQKQIWDAQSLKEIVLYATTPHGALKGFLCKFSPLMADFYFVNEKTKQRFDYIFEATPKDILYQVCEILANFGVDYIEHCKNQKLKLKGKKRILSKLNFLKGREIKDKLYLDKFNELESSLQERAKFKYSSLKEIKHHYKDVLLDFALKNGLQVIFFKENTFASAIVNWYSNFKP